MLNKTSLALLLALPVALGSCAVVAGGVAAVVITQEVLDNNTYVSHVNRDAKQVWPTVKVFLADVRDELAIIDDVSEQVVVIVGITRVSNPIEVEVELLGIECAGAVIHTRAVHGQPRHDDEIAG